MKQFEQDCEGSVKPGVFLSEDVSESENFEEDNSQDARQENGFIELSDNEVIVRLSATLMTKLKRASAEEGIELDELVSELVTEGVALRSLTNAQAPGPSHLMTRTGYLPPEAGGNSFNQPMLSHHQNGNGNGNGGGNRNNQNRNGGKRNNQNRSGGGNRNNQNRSGGGRGRPQGQR